MDSLIAKTFVILALLLLPMQALATKACALPPCYTDATASKFDKGKCSMHSDWIATGKINVIAHDYQGMPLNKDFLTFSFEAQQWEKGKQFAQAQLLFTVGWCENQIFPENVMGKVRIYGKVVPQSEGHAEYRFLYIEPLSR